MKKIFIFITLFLLTGCSNQYKLTINEDLSINEEIRMVAEDDYFFDMDYTEAKKVLDMEMGMKDKEKIYSYSLQEDNGYIVNLNRKFSNYQEYLEKSKLYKRVYENLNIVQNDNIIVINSIGDANLKDFVSYYEKDTEEEKDGVATLFTYDCYFSIKLPFDVVNHNADKVDKKNNIYYWIIENDTTNKEVNISFDINKEYISVQKIVSDNYTIFIIVAIIIVIALTTNKIIKKGRKNNEI